MFPVDSLLFLDFIFGIVILTHFSVGTGKNIFCNCKQEFCFCFGVAMLQEYIKLFTNRSDKIRSVAHSVSNVPAASKTQVT